MLYWGKEECRYIEMTETQFIGECRLRWKMYFARIALVGLWSGLEVATRPCFLPIMWCFLKYLI
jgi:hypothetical protein